MVYDKLNVGDLGTNCYLIKGKTGHIMIDPGSRDILNDIGDRKISAILLTHCHDDHACGVPFLKEKFDAPLIMSSTELEYHRMGGSMSSFLGNPEFLLEPEKTIEKDEDIFTVDGIEFKSFLLSGHTPGSLAFLYKDHLFCGDLIFKGSIGRTDLFGGDPVDMSASLRRCVDLFPRETVILPGHMDVTTMGRELDHNMIMKEVMEDDRIF